MLFEPGKFEQSSCHALKDATEDRLEYFEHWLRHPNSKITIKGSHKYRKSYKRKYILGFLSMSH